MENLYTFDFTYKQLLCFNKASVIMKWVYSDYFKFNIKTFILYQRVKQNSPPEQSILDSSDHFSLCLSVAKKPDI